MTSRLIAPSALAALVVLAATCFAVAAEDQGQNSLPAETSPSMLCGKAHLHFPVKAGAPRRTVRVVVEGSVQRVFQAEISDTSDFDWMADLDVSPWLGKNIALEVEGIGAGSGFWKSLRLADGPPAIPNLYQEKLRPQYHFSAATGRLNDPNGLVWYRGEYHLFFQYAPYSYGSGIKHWGHATSPDLVHWTQQPIAIHPDASGAAAASGSAVVDRDNTSGLGRADEPALVLNYTSAGKTSRVQSIVFSLDGRSFSPAGGRQVVGQITPKNRDPKVFWHEQTKRWVMALYSGRRHESLKDVNGKPLPVAVVEFLNSPNLLDYSRIGSFVGGVGEDRFLHECPDIFPLRVGGDPSQEKWVLTGANGQYRLGEFDGRAFLPDSPVKTSFIGNRYAGQVFSNEPEGRTVQMGWMIGPDFPGMPFNQCMSLPVELALVEAADGLQIASMPVRELEALRRKSYEIGQRSFDESIALVPSKIGELFDLDAEIHPGSATKVVLSIGAQELVYDVSRQTLRCGKFEGPLPLVDGLLKLRVLGDRTILEIFGAGGLLYMPIGGLPPNPEPDISIRAEGAGARIQKMTIYEMASAWPPASSQ